MSKYKNTKPESETSKRPNYALRRFIAALAVTGTLAGGAKVINELNQRTTVDGSEFSVDKEEVLKLPDSERDEQYETVVAKPGDTHVSIAKKYIEENNLGPDVDYREVVEALQAQDETPDNVKPGEMFYLPQQEKTGDK